MALQRSVIKDEKLGKWIAMIHEIPQRKEIGTVGDLTWKIPSDTPPESKATEELVWKIHCDTPGEAEFESKSAMKRLEVKV